MVRRRAAKAGALTAAGGRGVTSNLLENGEAKATAVGCAHLDEQYFASPKRKDCKVENCTHEMLLIRKQKNEKETKAHGKTKSSSSTVKASSERGGIAGRTIGVPLATRSQTRTIENFFKAKNAASNEKVQENDETKNEALNSGSDEAYSFENLPHYNGNAQPPTPDTPCELDEDTNDTEYSAQLTEEAVFGVDFFTHRSQLRDSHSSTGSACTNISNTENIFLQEPVLTLNVDKTPNQATSIKINTTLEVEPVFSSPPALASVLNGRFNQVVTLNIQKISPYKREPFSCKLQNMAELTCHQRDVVEELVPEQDNEVQNDNDNDSSSCDSGVAFTASLKMEELRAEEYDKTNAVATGEPARRRKPATPHRIVCPSPIKTMPHVISPMHAAIATGRISSPSGRKINKEHLSPRKSPRKVTNIHSKTRRRLNQQNEFSAFKPLSNGYIFSMVDNNVIEDKHHEVLKSENLKADIPTHSHKCTLINENMKQPQKPMTSKSHIVKTKLQNGFPLAITNNNRDLKEFFPVRRSVRKTKTVVKEEMMRTLEKAIIEEQADGLKVAHFEGKGRGIIADRHFQRGEFVVEYIGDLISMAEASEREKSYALDENAGCYMYYFKHKNQQYCIDATEDTGKLGRLVNHSRNGNLVTKVVVVKQRPHLILLAKDDIEPGEELTYDYGDRSKESLLHHPWLAF
ncbi:PREDICTED: histone-lysine N-methyltransferase pr-set7-like [Rhagoletis zephyria]|uniref:histone-lysine N-methyltransferase pr-set7-like n=1 Tax=Rhagoletis zephyria TaxID=28612 RepID=UPI0008116B2E|nr:PREDICTED: histone-lysine N-methyltransferase pr-set7-like [Rhagoletis zephyria]XP_017478165.1 PREDICTED: histone-lysine N-methyltransferase pr-set7-like [Rhagoletis zephyria]XP_017478167.1 PREDICTED: histone-lysine N-methyltransferase pr-set7-like [Rhagoletis zephyria]